MQAGYSPGMHSLPPSAPPAPHAIAPSASGNTGPAATTPAELMSALARLREAWQARKPDPSQRLDDLRRLHAALKARLDEMTDAVAADFGHRSRHESLLADGMAVLAEIAHLQRHLRRWSRPRRAAAGWRLWPARAQLRPQALGVVGVMAPWNYPVNLALVPLATAIAAGNHVLLKPSEHAPRTADFLHALLAEVFPAERVAVALGGADLAAAFSALPLDHLVFTGSTALGRKVMAAAAPNLTPLTLELGGKSPAIVAPDYPPAKAAARIATGKWFNAGQTCIAPDYAFVPETALAAFVEALRAEVTARYDGFAGQAADYTRIVNAAQYRRLRELLDDARARGARVLPLADIDPARAERERLLAPTLVLDAPDEARILREEIFGPLLPLKTYRTLDEALDWIAARERPLALYPFCTERAVVERILGRVVAGGVTVNDTLLHFAASGLPFGGIGASGMGAYHGQAGFDRFSHLLPVLWQGPLAASDRLKPPYAGIDRLVRWLARH